MTKRQQDRISRLLPGGIPRWIRIWDAGAEENDRYTICYTGRYRGRGQAPRLIHQWPWYQYVGMNSHPFHPSYGICQHGESQTIIDCPNGWVPQIGRLCRHNPELGRRIAWEVLPVDCQTVVMRDYCQLWEIPIPAKKACPYCNQDKKLCPDCGLCLGCCDDETDVIDPAKKVGVPA